MPWHYEGNACRLSCPGTRRGELSEVLLHCIADFVCVVTQLFAWQIDQGCLHESIVLLRRMLEIFFCLFSTNHKFINVVNDQTSSGGKCDIVCTNCLWSCTIHTCTHTAHTHCARTHTHTHTQTHIHTQTPYNCFSCIWHTRSLLIDMLYHFYLSLYSKDDGDNCVISQTPYMFTYSFVLTSALFYIM